MALHENITTEELRRKRREREARVREIEDAHDAASDEDPPGIAGHRSAAEVRRIRRASDIEDAVRPDVVER